MSNLIHINVKYILICIKAIVLQELIGKIKVIIKYIEK